MKCIIFDTGPIISLATNNLLWLLKKLNEKYEGNFCIPKHVEEELIIRPLKINRFKFEALQVMKYVENKTIHIVHADEVKNMTDKLLNLANNCFSAKNHWIQLVHPGEIEALAAAVIFNADALVIDERTARMLVENPKELANIMRKKLHTPIAVNSKNLKEFLNLTKKVKVIRSVELVTAAYELGLLDMYKPKIKNAEEVLLDSVLWGLKLRGCSIPRREIERIIKIEGQR